MKIECEPEGARQKGDGNAEEENYKNVQSGTHTDRYGRSECPADSLQNHHQSDLKVRFHAKKELKEFQSPPPSGNISLVS